MKRSKGLLLMLVVIMMVAVLSLTACGQQSNPTSNAPSTGDSAGTSKEGGKNFAFFISNSDNEFMVGLSKAVEDAAASRGVKVTVYSASSDPAKQVSQVDNAIAQKVDGIIIDPVSFDGSASAVKAAVDAKIPVITLHERVSNQDIAASYVGVDLKLGGVYKMEQIAKDLGGKGNIAVMYGVMGQTAQIAITDGYKEVLKKYPDIKIVLEGTGNWVPEDATKLAENWLSSGKQLDAIVCNNDGMALGVLAALRSANKVGQLKLYGLDCPPESMRAIKAGEETASIFNDAKGEAEKGMDTIIALTKGEKVEKEIIIPPIVITKDNVDQYIK